MKKIIFVTTNKGKVASAQEYFKKIKLETYNAELIEPRSEDIRGIAKVKVIQAYNIVGEPCIALDAGFFIDELNGFPKAYVNHALETIGIEGILKLMEEKDKRSCEFRSCLAFYDGKEIKFFESSSKGNLSYLKRGQDSKDKWSDLWYIFKPNHFNKTLAEFEKKDFEKLKALKEESAIAKFAKWYESN